MSESFEDTSTIHNIRLDGNFTITSNLTPEDPNLSWEAKGLLWYILSKPKDWKIHTWQLASIYKGGKQGGGLYAIKQIVKELRKYGYVKYTKTRSLKTGKFIHRYDVFPMPIKNFQKMFPEVDSPTLESPTLESQPVIINTKIPSTESLSFSSLQKEEKEKEQKLFLECEIKHPDGKVSKLSKEEISVEAVRKKYDWTAIEIDKAWEIISTYEKTIRDWKTFIVGIINGIRKDEKYSEVREQKKVFKREKEIAEKEREDHPIQENKEIQRYALTPDFLKVINDTKLKGIKYAERNIR